MWTNRPRFRALYFPTRFALVAILLTTVVRLVLLGTLTGMGEERLLSPDSRSYIDPALCMLETGRFGPGPANSEIAEVRRTPGYPAFIAVVFSATGNSVPAVAAAQVFGLAIVQWLAWCLGFRMGGRRAGNFAVVLTSLDINLTHYALLVLTETLFTLLLTLFAVYACRALRMRSPTRRLVSGVGLLLAAATFVRPITYPMIWPTAAFFAIVLARRGLGARRTAGLVLCMLAAFWLPVGGWQARNAAKTGYSGFSAISADSLLDFRAAGVLSIVEGISLDEARARLREEAGEYDPANPAQSVATARAIGSRIMLANPTAYARATANGIKRNLVDTGPEKALAQLGIESAGSPLRELAAISPTEYLRKWFVDHPLQFGMRAGNIAALLALYVGALWAVFSRSPVRARRHLLIAVCAYLLLVSAGPESYARFRVPCVPLLAALGAVAVYRLAATANSLIPPRGRPNP